MPENINFKVIITGIKEVYTGLRKEVGMLLASSFHFPDAKGVDALRELPVILFEGLSLNDLKSLKDPMLFLAKMGLEFNVTPQDCSEIPRLGWVFQKPRPIVSCPSCGDKFILFRATDTLPQCEDVAEPPPMKATLVTERSTRVSSRNLPEDLAAISAEFEQIDDLSVELDSMVQQDEELEEIEEIGSVSEELEEIGSFSEELEKIEDFSDELDKIEGEDLDSFDLAAASDELSNVDSLAMEDLGGISAEFEEIEGVSAEFERISAEYMEEDIGSLSAELEEIEGISAEFDRVSEADLERIEVIGDGTGKIQLAGVKKHSHNMDETGDEELEDIEDISAELERIADPLNENMLDNLDIEDSEQFNLSNFRDKAGLATVQKKPKIPAKFERSDSNESGPYNVTIALSGLGSNLEDAVPLIAQLQNLSLAEARDLAQANPTFVVARNVSQSRANSILRRFQELNFQGRIALVE